MKILFFSLLVVAHIAAADNQLTPEEKREGWKLLFDGQTTKGWHSFKKESFPQNGWIVHDGILELLARSKAGDIVTDEQSSEFDLTWDWQIERGGNNGLKYFVSDERNE